MLLVLKKSIKMQKKKKNLILWSSCSLCIESHLSVSKPRTTYSSSPSSVYHWLHPYLPLSANTLSLKLLPRQWTSHSHGEKIDFRSWVEEVSRYYVPVTGEDSGSHSLRSLRRTDKPELNAKEKCKAENCRWWRTADLPPVSICWHENKLQLGQFKISM